MLQKNLNNLLLFLTTTMNEFDFGNDEYKVKYFFDELQKLKNKLPTIEELEKFQKIEIDLEVKYDIFNELDNYFNPVYIEIKDRIHKEMIDKLRNENKIKRYINL